MFVCTGWSGTCAPCAVKVHHHHQPLHHHDHYVLLHMRLRTPNALATKHDTSSWGCCIVTPSLSSSPLEHYCPSAPPSDQWHCPVKVSVLVRQWRFSGRIGTCSSTFTHTLIHDLQKECPYKRVHVCATFPIYLVVHYEELVPKHQRKNCYYISHTQCSCTDCVLIRVVNLWFLREWPLKWNI